MTEHVLIALFAGSQDYQLDVIAAQILHDILDQVKAFLVCQSGHHADHHLAAVFFQSQLPLKGQLVLHLLFAEVLSIIGLYDHGVCLRVEIVIIDAVDNSSQAVRAGSHEAVQALAVEGHLDLLRVCVAYGSDGICIDDTAL